MSSGANCLGLSSASLETEQHPKKLPLAAKRHDVKLLHSLFCLKPLKIL
jgi:hypothetical protein